MALLLQLRGSDIYPASPDLSFTAQRWHIPHFPPSFNSPRQGAPMPSNLPCITPSDIRGRVPDELNEDIAARIAVAFIRTKGLKHIVVGHDARLSGPGLTQALWRALRAEACTVTDIGLCGTEEMYFAVFHGESAGIDGGIMLTASHNPGNENGMKLVTKGAEPVSVHSGLKEIANLAEQLTLPPAPETGPDHFLLSKEAYLAHLLAIIRPASLCPLKIVVNSGNGCAGPVVDLLAPHLPFHLTRLQHEPDGHFPHGVPNPLLPENRTATARAVVRHKADLGVAWDGDFDRCFFFDEQGGFIEGYYIVGLLAEAVLALHPGAVIVHDARLIWNTREVVRRAGGTAVMAPAGHALIKEAMRRLGAVYGGEMSSHHYFQEFGVCDSGMLAWLLVCRLLAEKRRPLSALCQSARQKFPASGEINFKGLKTSTQEILSALKTRYQDGELDETDGVSISYPDFRFNARPSGTEALLRLNVESRGNVRLLREKTAELQNFITSLG